MNADLIERARVALGTPGRPASYTHVAAYLNISSAMLSHIKTGKCSMEPIHAAKLAELLGERWYDYALPALAEQAKSQEDRDFWLGKLQALARTAGVPAAIVAGAILLSAALPVSSLKPGEFTIEVAANSLILQGQHTIHY